jgi:tRNA-specific 2-thiouridylase
MIKALGLFSGGLDSILAAKLLQEQGIKVELVNFHTPFFLPKDAKEMAKKLKMKLKEIDVTKDYLKVLRKPKHGYGSEMNPCIDCKIFMLKKAKKYAKKINAKFIFTGDVLGERPMSQKKSSMQLIEKEAGLKGKLLRPLSAKLLPITEAEKKWVDRKRLMDISGRGRYKQKKLIKKFKIKDYPQPSGGCLLTHIEYARKVRDLLKNKKVIKKEDIELFRIGRHFRYGKNKIIVGRNEQENKQLVKMKQKTDYMFEAPYWGSPITILKGPKTKKAIMLASRLTARYSDSKDEKTLIKYGKKKLAKPITVSAIKRDNIESLRI